MLTQKIFTNFSGPSGAELPPPPAFASLQRGPPPHGGGIYLQMGIFDFIIRRLRGAIVHFCTFIIFWF